jgi:O-antigen/teichoic acid export membrane protein
MTADGRGTSASTVSAVSWSGVAFGARVGTQLISLLLLSRILTPDDFGLMAMAAVVTGLASVVRDVGAGPALVREPRLTPSFVSSQFVVAATFGLVLAVMIVGVAPIAVAVFEEPDLAPILIVLALGFAIGGLGVVPQALLERRLAFRPIAVAEVIAGAVALVAAIVAATAGLGAIALAFQAVVQTTVAVFVLAFAARWLPTDMPAFVDIRRGLRFGTPLAGFATLNYLVRNADNALIGAVLGAGPLGYYSVAYRVMLLPVQVVNSVGNRVLLPVLAHGDRASQRAAYLSALGISAVVGLPIAAGLAGAADQVIRVLLGPGWEPSVPVLQLLSLVALAQVVGATVGPVFVATGHTDRLFAWGLISSLIAVASFIIGLPYGIVGVAAAYAIASLILIGPSMAVSLPLIDTSVADAGRRVAPALMAATAGGLVAYGIGLALVGPLPVIVLALQVAGLIGVYIPVLWVLDRASVRMIQRVARRAVPL